MEISSSESVYKIRVRDLRFGMYVSQSGAESCVASDGAFGSAGAGESTVWLGADDN